MDDFSKKALQCHNECRHLHQVPPLKWAADLASEAQEWANKIARANNLQHASKSERKNSGENIAMFSGRFDTAAEQATGMWYSEVENYKFEKPSFQPGTGHFTQVRNWSDLASGRERRRRREKWRVVPIYGDATPFSYLTFTS